MSDVADRIQPEPEEQDEDREIELVSPTGVHIVGTDEICPGRAPIDIWRDADGQLDGEPVVIDENGDTWLFRECRDINDTEVAVYLRRIVHLRRKLIVDLFAGGGGRGMGRGRDAPGDGRRGRRHPRRRRQPHRLAATLPRRDQEGAVMSRRIVVTGDDGGDEVYTPEEFEQGLLNAIMDDCRNERHGRWKYLDTGERVRVTITVEVAS